MNATAELDWIGTPRLFDEVVERVEAAQAQGMDVGLDFHGRVHRPMAKQLAKALEPLGLLFIEEPLLSENPEGLAQIAALTSTPIALGERLYSRWDFKPFFETRRGRHHPARSQPRRRHPRMPQDRGHGRGL